MFVSFSFSVNSVIEDESNHCEPPIVADRNENRDMLDLGRISKLSKTAYLAISEQHMQLSNYHLTPKGDFKYECKLS